MPQYLADALANTWVQLKLLAVIVCIGLMLEALRPGERDQPAGRIGFNLAWTVLYLFLANLLAPQVAAMLAAAKAQFGLDLPIVFPDGVLGQLAQAFALLATYDFFYYWMHRSQHRFGVLWAQHQVHHADLSLNVTTNNRHHWLEEPLRALMQLLPVAVLFQQKPLTIAWIAMGITLYGYFIHLNVRLHLGPLTPILAGPQLHRIHHSRLPQHHDRNFAAFFPIYDVLFGTYYRPAPDEYPPTGLADGKDLNGLLRASAAPFRDWRDMWRRRRQPTLAQSQPGPVERAPDQPA